MGKLILFLGPLYMIGHYSYLHFTYKDPEADRLASHDKFLHGSIELPFKEIVEIDLAKEFGLEGEGYHVLNYGKSAVLGSLQHVKGLKFKAQAIKKDYYKFVVIRQGKNLEEFHLNVYVRPSAIKIDDPLARVPAVSD